MNSLTYVSSKKEVVLAVGKKSHDENLSPRFQPPFLPITPSFNLAVYGAFTVFH